VTEPFPTQDKLCCAACDAEDWLQHLLTVIHYLRNAETVVGGARTKCSVRLLSLLGVHDCQLISCGHLSCDFFVGVIVSAAGIAYRDDSSRASNQTGFARNVALFVLIGSLLAQAAMTILTSLG
jgi:hypothetical protein